MLDSWGYQLPLHLAALAGIVVVAARWNRVPRAAAVLALCGLAVIPAAAVLVVVFVQNWYSLYSALDLDGPDAMGNFFLAANVIASLLQATGAGLVLTAFLKSRRAPRTPAGPPPFAQHPAPALPQHPPAAYPPYPGARRG